MRLAEKSEKPKYLGGQDMGYEFENQHQKQSKPFKWWLWGPIGLVVMFFMYGLYSAGTPEGKARIERDMAIEICWQDYERRSNTPAEKRFIAEVCEKKEADAKKQR